MSFTPAEMARLAAIFPNGVCNWDVPGLDQRRLIAPWLSFGAD